MPKILWKYLAQTVGIWIAVCLLAAAAVYHVEVRLTLTRDELDGSSDYWREYLAGATYRDSKGATIVERGDALDLERITRLRAGGHEQIKVLSFHMFANYMDALWWSVVTASTVGYGDKYPESGSGRFIAAALMASAWILIIVTTSRITTALILRELRK